MTNPRPPASSLGKSALHGVSLVYVLAVLLGTAAQIVDPTFAAVLGGTTHCRLLEGDARCLGHDVEASGSRTGGSSVSAARPCEIRARADVWGVGLAGPQMLLDRERSTPPPTLG